jgi:prophage DNA circulation protein
MAGELVQVPVADNQILQQGSSQATTILQLQSGIAWRQYLKRASFRGQQFYVDTGVRESGRRVVGHEFPKRDVPYAEDMGRRAREFTVRGYLIVYPTGGSDNSSYFPNDPLKRASYIKARDALIAALESTDGPANLQLPLLGILNVMCQRYRVTEEEKYGGYCVFDMTFMEFGQAPQNVVRQSAAGVQYAAQDLDNATQAALTSGISKISSAVTPV